MSFLTVVKDILYSSDNNDNDAYVETVIPPDFNFQLDTKNFEINSVTNNITEPIPTINTNPTSTLITKSPVGRPRKKV